MGLSVEIARGPGDSCPVYDDVFQQPVNVTFTFFPCIHLKI